MTVAELIVTLQELPPDLVVLVPDPIHSAAEVSAVEVRDVADGIESGRVVYVRRAVIS